MAFGVELVLLLKSIALDPAIDSSTGIDSEDVDVKSSE